MPSMPTYHVNKGSQFGFLDTTLGGANFRTELDAALTRLQGADPAAVLNTAAHARVAPSRLTQNDFNHFVQDWLGGGWWPQNAVPDTLRAGFTKAIERAKASQLPIEVLWVCARDPDFHVYYCEGPRQVTVLVFSPPPRGHTDLPLDHSENIWVVKLRDPNGSDDRYPNLGTGIPAPQVVATVQSGPMAGRDIIQQQLFYAD
jgi:hypothetical protein